MKKIIYSLAAVMLCVMNARSQNLAINTDGSAPNANAILDVKSNSKGILIPRMSSAERLAIPATRGLLVYDVTTNSFWYNTGAEWKTIAGSTALASGDAWLLDGNAGTDSSNFLGTTDNAPLRIRVNNLASGGIYPANSNTFWGYRSGAVTTGTFNTGAGHEALANNTTGVSNSAFGRFALRWNTTGRSNTAVGMDALTANTIGSRNTAVGMLSMLSNTTGAENVAIGFDALRTNLDGGGNTVVGTGAMYKSKDGSNNTAIGNHALYGTVSTYENTSIGANSATSLTGNYNTAVGSFCMWIAGSGESNTAVGFAALTYNQTGHNNTAVGRNTLGGSQGSYNTGIGSGADTQGDIDNATAIGAGAIADASNKVRIGNSAVTVIEGQVPFTTPSDGRFKFNIEENVKGIDFIMQLRPVTYQFDVKRFDGKFAEKASTQSLYAEAENMRRSGFIAQEVEKAAIATGYNFSGLITPKKDGDHYSLSYDAFVVPLVKAMQEQQLVIDDQNKKIAELQAQLDEIKKLLQHKK